MKKGKNFSKKKLSDIDGNTEKIEESIEENIERRAKLSRMRSPQMKFLMVFIIKTMETFAASVIPSFISVAIIFINPNERSWTLMKIVSFIITAIVNWRLWVKYAAMKTTPKEFYLMNGLTYCMYGATSIIGYYTMGYLVYSLIFANLRIFEALGVRTLHSVLISNGIMLIILCCCERFSHFKLNKFLAWARKNGADSIEMEDEAERLVPKQKNKLVQTLSIEELAEHERKEALEVAAAKKAATEAMPETVWDETTFVKGRGEAVEHVETLDIDNDITEGDFNAEALADEEYMENMKYSRDALWNSNIYSGRTADGKPVTEYGEDEEIFNLGGYHEESTVADDDAENDSLWEATAYRGRTANNSLADFDDTEGDTPDDKKIDYDADSLWETSFYQGRNKSAVPERVLDFDETVSKREETNFADSLYDNDRLWDSVSHGNDNDIDEDDSKSANMSADYDADSLWSSEAYQGRKPKT